MAEIIASEKSRGKSSQKKKPIRVDMTPLVDLGFLLITFFMFTTNFSKPNVMDLGLPADDDGEKHGIVIDYKNQITFILGKDNSIYYYQQELESLSKEDLKPATYKTVEIAKLIESKKKIAPRPEIFTVIIKPTDDSSYQNFVDVMDEIAISKNERYGVAELQKNEEKIYQEISQ